jgi:hypothetical protein
MRLTCFHCDKPFEVSTVCLGGEVYCPYCRKRMRLPSTGATAAEEEEDEEGGRSGSWTRSLISSLVSCVVHATTLVVLALVTCDRRGEGGANIFWTGGTARDQLSEITESPLDAGATTIARQDQDEIKDALEEVSPPVPTSELASSEVQISQLAPSGAAGGAPEIGLVTGGGGALGSGASFMGIRAQGKRFCIVADRSGSMAGPKLEYVKQEILETLTTMKSGSRFQLVLYNHETLPYPRTGWRIAQKDKGDVEEWLRGVSGAGGTYPTPAFTTAFKLEPRPDVIFFLTDGLFDSRAVDEVAAMNRREDKKVVIHTISFVERSAEPLLRQIAKDSGGTYRHVAGF